MKRRLHRFLPVALVLCALPAWARMDLVTVPNRDSVQLTIYNAADLTLVRERRELTLRQGTNRLQFAWANTLIDSTSLEMAPMANADKIEVLELDFPRPGNERVPSSQLGIWTVRSQIGGKVPVEITYLTSGFSWRAFYMGTLAPDEKTMRLEGYVRVDNRSGEDYADAQTRLIVGKIRVLDPIATLAQRIFPFGDPRTPLVFRGLYANRTKGGRGGAKDKESKKREEFVAEAEIKEVIKEGLSEYFLYTIAGTETIPDGWGKRLPAFKPVDVPVVNLYKYEAERYGDEVARFLSFKNDKEHQLGENPIPDGVLRVYRTADATRHLSYEGESGFKYIPVGQEVELNLGPAAYVIVKPTLMGERYDKFVFDKDGNISEWDEIQEFKVEVNNTRDVPVKVEVQRNFAGNRWELEKSGDFGAYERVDLDTVKFTLALGGRSQKVFHYALRLHCSNQMMAPSPFGE